MVGCPLPTLRGCSVNADPEVLGTATCWVVQGSLDGPRGPQCWGAHVGPKGSLSPQREVLRTESAGHKVLRAAVSHRLQQKMQQVGETCPLALPGKLTEMSHPRTSHVPEHLLSFEATVKPPRKMMDTFGKMKD